MKFARVFLNPSAATWVDFGMQPNAELPMLWVQVQKEGFIVGEVAVVPLNSIHHMMMLDTGTHQTTLTVFPGGKS